MPGTMILVSGMPATGKSTFARWLGERLSAPVLSYDRILRMLRSAGETQCGDLGYRVFLYELEEHMGTPFIADYIFSVKQEEWLREMTARHPCRSVNVHFDCAPETAYRRYTSRNAQDAAPTRPKVAFAAFEQATRQNRDFRWGDKVIDVNTEDFACVSYEEIYQELIGAVT